MKRIDAMIPSVRRNSVVAAIMDSGVPGLTISETRGRGSGKRPLVSAARASVRYIAEYNRTDLISIIVDDSKVQTVLDAIMNAAHTGKPGDGKIFVSTVEEMYDVATKSKASM
ncbi:MAG: P-II family nitrogen regulator [Nitrosopumilaceae archaeon]